MSELREQPGVPEDAKPVPTERPSVFRSLFYSLVIIPFMVSVGGVFLYLMLLMLTTDQVDVFRLLEDVREGGSTRRWQSAYALSAILADPATWPEEPRFTQALLDTFDQSANDSQPAARQYMALALGKTGKRECLEPLCAALEKDPLENRVFLIRALGTLRNPEAAPCLLPLLDDPQAFIRLETVMALGNIGAQDATPKLAQALEDPEPNVRWDAAIALAKLGRAEGKPILLMLLDPRYLEGFENVSAEERTRATTVAAQAAQLLNDAELDAAVQKLAKAPGGTSIRN